MMCHVPNHYWDFDDLRKRVISAVPLTLAVAAIIALYVLMFLGVYRWSLYAPIFPPDATGGPAITQPLE